MQQSLTDLLIEAVEVGGRERAEAALRKVATRDVEFDDPTVAYVVTTVGSYCDIQPHEIIYGVGRKNERKIAIGFIAHYLHKIYGMEMEDVRRYLNKEVSLCHRYSRMINKLNPRHPMDEKYCTINEDLKKLFVKPDPQQPQ